MDATNNITARDWQLAIGQPGTALTGDADIGQCLRVILTTPKGSDPLRPEFGSDVGRYVDWPVDLARPHIVREVWDAVALWEPRIDPGRVTARLGDVAHQLLVTVYWTRRGMAGVQSTEVTL
ncbi:GPW/gp25 family protein [Acidovorax sp. GBBC 3332]|nr:MULTISPECIES: GPW/gp25 family protein [unclassified Acidovorax]MDA8449846.1 GPW/gp25 family protein [Acidovorax sp. GBBC 3297]MDA8459291.1 GPW/gp25 family protein [Acidovorax sp. GBBC 3333]MDA8464328.1 GPW/gp25 family protein [Acidovorax sp. GBBC 3332]MDA8469461.1 GPW/gp25 family protein [Acidovorax sp. GBBC 3299]